MIKFPILNSPGYYITEYGDIYNSNGDKLKTFKSSDGYLRIEIPSLAHNKRVKRSIHKIMAEVFLNNGIYFKSNTKQQVNHIDGNKLNNHYSNLEIISNTENVNKAHNMGLYRYDVSVKLKNLETNEIKIFRSLRELARYLNVSINYVKPRIVISSKYPLYGKYYLSIDVDNYLNFISKIKNSKKIYVYDHVSKKKHILTSYSQISLLFGLPYTTIGKKLNRNPKDPVYSGGYTFSLIDFTIRYEMPKKALSDRYKIWLKVIANK